MSAAMAANDPGALHHVATVLMLLDRFGVEAVRVTWPAGAGIKLGVGGEERLSAANTDVSASLMTVPVLSGEGAFGPFFARDVILLGRQLFPPFRVAFLDGGLAC